MGKLNKIIIHWTAGAYKPNSVDLRHYHFLIDDQGRVNYGIYKPEDNEDCTDGRYAQHTGGGNTGAIGVALCGMSRFSSSSNMGNYPLTKVQCEAAFAFLAKLAKKYNIAIDDEHIMTHYEFGKLRPNTSSAGKIDIIYLPPYPEITTDEVGNFIRRKIKWYTQKI